MSRSFKKTPGWTDRDPWMKNYANRRIRRKPVEFEIADGGSYRKLTCPWDICDWKFLLYTEIQMQDYIDRWDDREPHKYRNK